MAASPPTGSLYEKWGGTGGHLSPLGGNIVTSTFTIMPALPSTGKPSRSPRFELPEGSGQTTPPCSHQWYHQHITNISRRALPFGVNQHLLLKWEMTRWRRCYTMKDWPVPCLGRNLPGQVCPLPHLVGSQRGRYSCSSGRAEEAFKVCRAWSKLSFCVCSHRNNRCLWPGRDLRSFVNLDIAWNGKQKNNVLLTSSSRASLWSCRGAIQLQSREESRPIMKITVIFMFDTRRWFNILNDIYWYIRAMRDRGCCWG